MFQITEIDQALRFFPRSVRGRERFRHFDECRDKRRGHLQIFPPSRGRGG